MRGARGGQWEAASQPSPPRGGIFSSIKSALQGWNSRGADQGDSEPGAAGEGARLSPRAPVLRLAVLLWSAALLAPLPRQAQVEPGRSTLAGHLLSRVALLLAAPAQAQSTGICDRTPAVQTRILEKISGITDCGDVTSSHLSGLTGSLNLASRSLTSLQENDFDGLSKLNFLYLNDNSLSSLEEDIFNDLSSLRILTLNNNSLSILGENIFNGLSNLQRLWLDNNSLSSLHVDIFNGLTSVQWLTLNNNSLRSLPEGLLSSSRLPRLSFLRSSNNLLMCLPRDLAGRPSSIIIDNAVRDLPDCYGVSLSVSPTEVSEGSGGESITVTATLKDGNRVKTEATTVTISVEDGSAIEGEDFEAVSDFAITIASGSSSNSGTFTLTAKRDLALEESETVKVTGRTGLSNSSVAGTEVEEAEVSIRNTPPGVDLSATSLTVEEGESGSYTVVLDTQPSGTVTITASSGDTTVATVMPSSLTFTTSNWDTAQTVTVRIRPLPSATASAAADTAPSLLLM